ncbi:hypothetical protein FE257_009052 [Aspergillus nanangensis]|uniref:Pentatricopeptide repeat protein n=1 Tax=Aspergillus nanangensis TaxID=2582783 RepID=A0AAD4CWM2_ASPNN|nr:hypothetical protein FE257_009052 [Aspergillus nanangensis]
MISKPTSRPTAVPSRNALRVLRRLALAGSTVGSFCTVAAITYDAHRRVRVAERIVENKRALQTSAPNYDATSAATRLSRMMEAAEAGEYTGMDAFKEADRRSRLGRTSHIEDRVGMHNREEQRAFETQTQGEDPSTQAESFLEAAQSNISRSRNTMQSPGTTMMRNDFIPPDYTRTPDTLERSKLAFEQSKARASSLPLNQNVSMHSPDASIPTQMQDLLDRGRPIDAAQVFLDTHPASLNGISSDRRELAVNAFYINCKEENVFVARNIFERLEQIDKISPSMWKLLIFALARKGCIESAATIYTRYMHKFSVPADIVDVVLRCLLESHRLTTAKWFLFRNLKIDRDCGLCGAYLTGLWRKTRSIELLNGQLKKLLTMFPRLGKDPSDKLFNPVIKAYVEYGRLADAEAMVEDMMNTYQLPLRCRTKGLLVFGKALKCDWDGVDAGLQEMYVKKLTNRRRDFLPIFDRIFLEYWPCHTGDQIRDFVIRYVDKFDIVPDRVLYKHILEAYVEKGNKEMISELARMARERSWKVHVNESEFLEMLRMRRLALEDAPVGFWQMLQAARAKFGQSAASQQILGYDQRSFPIPEVNKMPYTETTLPWYQRTLHEMTPSKPVNQYQKLHKQMTHYIHVGKMDEALKCFENAKNARFQMKQLHVELAVIATLLGRGLNQARALIEAEWRNIRHLIRFFPVFFRQILEVDGTSESQLIQMAVLRFYQLCWSNKMMIVKHHITVATSRQLIARKQPDMAVELLNAVYTSRYRQVAAFDGVCMKMFMRAFTATENMPGIRWCLLTGLARGSAISHDFVVEVHRNIGILNRSFDPDTLSKREATRKMEQLEYLTHLADLLKEKSEGDPQAWKLKSDPTLKRSYRRMLKRPLDQRRLYKESDIQEAVERWDEEYELEAVVGNIEINPKAITKTWNETAVLGQMSNPTGSSATAA